LLGGWEDVGGSGGFLVDGVQVALGLLGFRHGGCMLPWFGAIGKLVVNARDS
jgi:hypothetical protein